MGGVWVRLIIKFGFNHKKKIIKFGVVCFGFGFGFLVFGPVEKFS